ncbi:sensor histidine kinase [Polaribacter sp. Hel1_85]|uniref:sensor histidine kinase n=1 Tax=Polaribacter sp. Hel1_85 TaxID=1250005 RepID=UPI00052DC590|nr:sensor histidine kinase [Polaribacter sp. Hel1_85]KGL63372.1 signal transduction histidine kinase [Polaribacter sp. Hel1_85]
MILIKRILILFFPFFTFGQNIDLLKKGDFFFDKSVNDSAVFYYDAGTKNCKNCDEALLAEYYLKFGKANRLIGNIESALVFYLKAEKIFNNLNNYNGLFEAKINLAEFYRSIDEIEKSFYLIEEAEKISKKNIIRKEVLAYYYNRRAAIIADKFDDKDEVIRLSKKSIQIAEELKANKLLIYSYNELAYVYESQNKKDLALKYYFKAFNIAEKLDLGIEMCDVLYNIGREEFLRIEYNIAPPKNENPKLYKKARDYFKQGLELATKINYLERQKDFSKRLFHNFVKTHQFKEAIKYNELYHSYNEQLLKNNKQKEIAEIEAKYLNEKKDNQIILNEKEIRVQYFILFCFGILLLLLLLFFIKSRKDKFKIEDILEQKTVLLKEIHHRVKNNLQLTSSLLYLQANKHNDPKTSAMVKESQKQISSIALVHEMLYQDDTVSLISIDQYLKELGSRLLQFSPSKNIVYNLDTKNVSLPIDYATTLGLILNELITNSLKHAFKDDKGVIVVSLEKIKGKQYKFTYSDNGVGLPKKLKESTHKTLGLKLIKMFAEEIDAQLEVINEGGLTYRFIFKNKYDTDV